MYFRGAAAMIAVQLAGIMLTSAIVTAPLAAIPLYLSIFGAAAIALWLMLGRHLRRIPPQAPDGTAEEARA